MKEAKIKVDQTKVLDTVLKEIKYEFETDILVKPMPIDKVTVKQTVVDEEGAKDEEGNFTETKEITEEVESRYNKSVVLKLPVNYYSIQRSAKVPEEQDLKPGDIIVHLRTSRNFDLYRDSLLIKPYEVVARVK